MTIFDEIPPPISAVPGMLAAVSLCVFLPEQDLF